MREVNSLWSEIQSLKSCMSSIVTNQASDSYLRDEISQLRLSSAIILRNLLLHNNHLNLILSHHRMSILHPEISVWWPGTVMVYQTLCHICKYLHNVLSYLRTLVMAIRIV